MLSFDLSMHLLEKETPRVWWSFDPWLRFPRSAGFDLTGVWFEIAILVMFILLNWGRGFLTRAVLLIVDRIVVVDSVVRRGTDRRGHGTSNCRVGKSGVWVHWTGKRGARKHGIRKHRLEPFDWNIHEVHIYHTEVCARPQVNSVDHSEFLRILDVVLVGCLPSNVWVNTKITTIQGILYDFIYMV